MNINILKNVKKIIHIEKINQPDSRKFVPMIKNESLNSISTDSNKLNRSIIINTENGYIQLVLPSHYRVNYSLLNNIVTQKSGKLNNLDEVQDIFPDFIYYPDRQLFNMCELPVYIYFVDYSADEKENISDAGSFLDLMVNSYKH